MRGRLRRFVAGNLIKNTVHIFNGFWRNSQQTVSRVYKSNGINDSYRPQDFTIRKITGNLPIAGKNTKGSLFPPFLCKCFFPKIFLKKKVKNYCSLVTKERYKFIKPDRILSAENLQIISFKIWEQLRFAEWEKVSVTKLGINWLNHLELLSVTAHQKSTMFQ